MWVKRVSLTNVRSFKAASVYFSRGVNVFVGPNNSGKSTFLLPLLSMQKGLPALTPPDVRIGESDPLVEVEFDQPPGFLDRGGKVDSPEIVLEIQRNAVRIFPKSSERGPRTPVNPFPDTEPGNFIYPFLSLRKVTKLNESVLEQVVKAVEPNLVNLNAKIDRLSNPEYQPAHGFYMDACDEILGLRITTSSTGQGKQAVVTVGTAGVISLMAMGAGTLNVLGLIVNLALAEDRLFLIEEPENDIHPRALKALLRRIVEKSERNQFVITTHSNIVLRTVGAASEAKVFRFDLTWPDRLPTSTVEEVESTPEHRRAVLQELGYEFSDLDLWEGWLILEEASAEKIIRKYLVPWFFPSLQGRLATFSARSLSQVKRKFNAFTNLFVFLHLQPVYKDRAWVLVDGGEEEAKVIQDLCKEYPTWNAEHFRQLGEHDFEHYYPERFAAERDRVLSEKDKQKSREGKKKLLDEVEAWAEANPEEAKVAFEKSAGEVITILKQIESQLGTGAANPSA